MKHYLQEIDVATSRPIEFVDVTARVRAVVASSGITNGLVSVFSNHTTTGIRINEHCSRLQKDMEILLSEVVPAERPYRHNETTIDGRGNAHSHLMSLLIGVSETVPLTEGHLRLGTWQSIFFVELDGPRRKRSVTVSVVGE